MVRSGLGGAAALCLLASLWPAPGRAGDNWIRQFRTSEDFAAWRGEGIEAGGPGPAGLQVRGGETFRLISPPGLGIPAAERPYLRIRFQPYSPRYLRVFWIDRAGHTVPTSLVIQPPFDRRRHTFWIPLARGEEDRGTVETLGVAFGGHPGWVEIESVEIRPFSRGAYISDQVREFLLPRAFHPGTINSLPSPRIFNHSLVGGLNKAALVTFLAGAFFYLKYRGKRGRKVAFRAGLAFLLIWMVYDLRDAYSHLLTAREIHQDFVDPPPEKQTFPALGDFYRFVSFCREHLPPVGAYDILPRGYWPYDCRLNYFLYPRHYLSERNRDYYAGQPLHYLVYNQPAYRFDRERHLVVSGDGGPATRPGRLEARYNRDSFIFREE